MNLIALYLLFALFLSYALWNGSNIGVWTGTWPKSKQQEYYTAMKQGTFLITCISLVFLLLNDNLSKFTISNLFLATAIILLAIAIRKTKDRKYLLELKLSENRVLNYFILIIPITYILIITGLKLLFAFFDVSF